MLSTEYNFIYFCSLLPWNHISTFLEYLRIIFNIDEYKSCRKYLIICTAIIITWEFYFTFGYFWRWQILFYKTLKNLTPSIKKNLLMVYVRILCWCRRITLFYSILFLFILCRTNCQITSELLSELRNLESKASSRKPTADKLSLLTSHLSPARQTTPTPPKRVTPDLTPDP